MVQLSCRCGQVALEVDIGPGSGTRVVCYCRDCRAAARLCPEPDALLTREGGVDIWQTTPDRVTITRGAELLEILRLSPKGLLRWRATCCGTPVCNMLEKPDLPFVGMVLRPGMPVDADAVFGAARSHVYTRFALAGRGAPDKDRGFNAVGLAVLTRMLKTRLGGRGKINPFRTEDGTPIALVRLADKAEVDRARAP